MLVWKNEKKLQTIVFSDISIRLTILFSSCG